MPTIPHDSRLDPSLSGYQKSLYRAQVSSADCYVYASNTAASALLTQFTYGEPLKIYDESSGYVFAQSQRDSYCGWVQLDHITKDCLLPSHHMICQAPALEKPNLKSAVSTILPTDSLVEIKDMQGDYYKVSTLNAYIHKQHVQNINTRQTILATAYAQLNRAYVWAGRGRAGIDCSAFAQLCYRFSGIDIPRDSDLQRQLMSAQHHQVTNLDEIEANDLLFIPGHVMLAINNKELIHATAHHMKVVIEPIDIVIRRIQEDNGAHYLPEIYRWVNK